MDKLEDYLRRKMLEKHPRISFEDMGIALAGFYEYIGLVREYGEVPMFSRTVDDIWHFLILNTKFYSGFCDEHLGYFLHHYPSDPTGQVVEEEKALCLLWMQACKQNKVDPFDYPTWASIPKLFLADKVIFGIEGGYIDPYDIVKLIREDRDNQIKKAAGVRGIFHRRDDSTYSKALRDKYPTTSLPDKYFQIVPEGVEDLNETSTNPVSHSPLDIKIDTTPNPSDNSPSSTSHHSCGSSSNHSSSYSCSSSSSCGSSSSCSS